MGHYPARPPSTLRDSSIKMQVLTPQSYQPPFQGGEGDCYVDYMESVAEAVPGDAQPHHNQFQPMEDYLEENEYQTITESWDQCLERGWWSSLIPRNGWRIDGNEDSCIAPAIGYTAGGHIAPHHDQCSMFCADSHFSTFLVCYASTDVSGGTRFFFGVNNTLVTLRKESVTPGSSLLFPAYLVHSGAPVSAGAMKIIGQFIVRETRVQVPLENLVRISLKDGSVVVREEEYALLLPDAQPEMMTLREFHPTYCALRGHPTYGTPLVAPEHQISGGSPQIYDVVENGWYATLDEATYYASGSPVVAVVVHEGKQVGNDVAPENLPDILSSLGSFRSREQGEESAPRYPFLAYGKLEMFDNRSQNVHVAWRILTA
jgi:hypothetical protein